MQKRWSTKRSENASNKQVSNSVGNNDNITPQYRHDKQTIDNKQYTYIDKYSSLSEEELKEKKRLKENSEMLGNGV